MQNRRVVLVIVGNTDTRYPTHARETNVKPTPVIPKAP